MEEKELDFSSFTGEYEDSWIALSADESRIIAHDKSFEKAFEKARERGEDHPVMLKAPSTSGSYVL